MLLFTLCWSLFASAAFAAFGYTDNGNYWTIDSGSNLVIQVSKTNGDITSMKYKGVEYNGYSGKNTHVESGLGASKVTIQQFTDPAYIIKVSVTYGTLKHYLFVRYKNDNVYIFTNKADASVTVHRYIVRMKGGSFPYKNSDSDFYPAGTSFIEASDVSGHKDGTTWSKHYNGGLYGRVKDFDYVGVSKPGVGVYMIRSNHEKASGGPFFRSLQRRADAGGEDLYDIYYYNMGHTDPERFGLQGPSVLSFTDGSGPNTALFARNADWGWFDNLGIDGWVPASRRGAVAGVGLSNMKSGRTYTVGLSNANAQYWTTAASSGGAWQINKALPGTYTLTVYKDELEVYTGSATITAGGKAALNTISLVDPSDRATIWRIGDWDGTPGGFLNFETTPWKPTYMHPSDKRIASWDVGNFIVGTTAVSSFPSYMWQDINNGHVIYFRLTAEQLTQPHTVRIGLTEAYIGGRPQIKVNSWSSKIPAATKQASTRSLTVGTYRGNNVVLEYTVPASAWVQSTSEWQVLTIDVVTGSTGTKYLSGGISFDCVELV
ncbi:rhamnogalacturonan lyase [Diaporthe helianthi]|uniref:rhamnogalacturonan endolyase n=1 Tax=Diaporthe helianthi TaxID=158607 RepID=A0A2P5HPL2_DIAHE|nr:rhamnogalacturonan lyase [Diaporthe helianthi]